MDSTHYALNCGIDCDAKNLSDQLAMRSKGPLPDKSCNDAFENNLSAAWKKYDAKSKVLRCFLNILDRPPITSATPVAFPYEVPA
jgi:hypothetical protein